MEREIKLRSEVEEIEGRREEENPGYEEKWQTEGEVLRTGKKGRTKFEVKKMMRGLKAMKNVMKEPKLTRTNRKRKEKKEKNESGDDREEAVETEERMPEEHREEEMASESVRPLQEEDYSPEPYEETGENIEEFWRRVREQEESYVREDELRQRRAALRRRNLLDDVPMSIKRKPEEEEGGIRDLDVRKKFQKSFFTYVQNIVMEDEILEALALETGKELQHVERKNEWIKGEEVQKLAELLDLPITAIRLHKQPRKKMQSPGNKTGRGRITVMILKKAGEAIVYHENADEVKRKPRGSMPMKWRGMTLFVKEKIKKAKDCLAYIQVDDTIYKMKVPDGEVWESFVRRENDLEIGAQALLLKLKASGKELDPKHFDSREQEEFQKSDIKEWQSWVDNEVLERLTPQEAARIPKEQVFRAPLRMLRVNKGKNATDLQAKSRLIIPGHLDPELGDYRTDSPTTMPVAVRLLKTLIVTRGWEAWVFDVSTAFLSGKHTQRVVYIRAPPEALPEVRGMSTVAPHELLRIVKGAYGLAEAPRLWYLRAIELLEKAGMVVELTFCRSTFILKDSAGAVQAICCMHVDDGLIAGNPQSEAYKQLLRKVDASFSIKEWKKVGKTPVTYLGMDMTCEKGVFTDDIRDYVLKIQAADINGRPQQRLEEKDTTAFLKIIMQMRWPAQHVLPEFMSAISLMTQRTTKATYTDLKKANMLLEKMKWKANNGETRLHYRKIEGKVIFITFFDASLGKKVDQSTQSGKVHFVSSEATTTSVEWWKAAWQQKVWLCRWLQITSCSLACYGTLSTMGILWWVLKGERNFKHQEQWWLMQNLCMIIAIRWVIWLQRSR